ncbi:MAG: radical SAM protein [Synergistaceae bacterium]|jgi:MoaA/NifB/PqqE/SkfB family radical SAM enzyme|nr:radical SAM protein [Synergistaceae bacterium]
MGFKYSNAVINFSIINACNCKCWFCCCGYAKAHEAPTKAKKLSLKDIKKAFVGTPPDEKLRRIIISGSGESILNPECVEIARFLKKQTKYLILISNGVLMKKETSARLIEAGVDEIRLSVTGATSEVWKVHQGCGYVKGGADRVFERLLRNIRDLCENRDRINPEFMVGVNYILKPDTKDHLLYYLQTMRNIGVNFVELQLFNEIGHTDNAPKQFLIERTAERKRKRLPLCHAIGENMATDIQTRPGDIWACCLFNHPDLVVGNILENSIYDILRGEKFTSLYSELKSCGDNIPEICEFCMHRLSHVTYWEGRE